MTVKMDIQIAEDISDSVKEPPPSSQLLAWAQAAWQGDLNADTELSLRVVSADESQQLNNDYRGKNNPTNVLSFPMQMEEEFLSFAEQDAELDSVNDMFGNVLGDLAICAEVVEREAKQQNKSSESHWAHMLVHGMLHLQGYDHIENDEAEEMEALEKKIMQQLGFADPYQINADLTDATLIDKKS